MIAVVMGGAASKKSEYAEQLVINTQDESPVYLATMKIYDDIDAKTVERHRLLREGKNFITVEKPLGLANADIPEGHTVLLECISNLVANEMFDSEAAAWKEIPFAEEMEDSELAAHTELAYNEIVKGIDAVARKSENLIIVTGNIFEDGVTYDSATMAYMELYARVNNYIAGIADSFTELVYGIPLQY